MSNVAKVRTLCHDILRVAEPIGKGELSEYDKSNIRFALIKAKRDHTESLNGLIKELDVR